MPVKTIFERSIAERTKLRRQKDKEFIKYIENESKSVNYDLFKIYFNFVTPIALAKQLYETKDENKNNDLVYVIKSGLRDLNDKIKRMSKEEIEIEKSDKILKIVEDIV